MLVDATNPITKWLFPPRCVLCRYDCMGSSLCLGCSSQITKASKSTSMMQHQKPALFVYEGVIKQIILQAKFRHSLHAAHVLMNLVKEELYSSSMVDELKLWAPDGVSFIPMHWLHRMRRGIDVPQLFALMLARLLKVPLMCSLKRTTYSYRQALRARKSERKIGIAGAFAKKRCQIVPRLLLVDDIITTGATFDESKKVLKEISEKTICLAIARTP